MGRATQLEPDSTLCIQCAGMAATRSVDSMTGTMPSQVGTWNITRRASPRSARSSSTMLLPTPVTFRWPCSRYFSSVSGEAAAGWSLRISTIHWSSSRRRDADSTERPRETDSRISTPSYSTRSEGWRPSKDCTDRLMPGATARRWMHSCGSSSTPT